MATKGTIKVRVTDYDELSFIWERTSVSVANNTSTISWRMVLTSTAYGAITSSVEKAWSVNVDGKTYSGKNSVAIGNNATKVLAQGTTTIAHNYDGTKNFAIKFSQQFAITFAGASVGTISKEATATLDTIKRRADIISAADFTDEGNPSFTYTPIQGVKKLSFYLSVGNASVVVNKEIPATGSSYTFVLTDDDRQYMRETNYLTNTMTATYELVTVFDDGTQLSSTKTATARIVNANPTITLATVEDNRIATLNATGDANVLIRSQSHAIVYAEAEGNKGAGIQSIIWKNGSKTINAVAGTFPNVESGTFVVEVTDTRGNKATQTITKDLIAHIPVSIGIDDLEITAAGTVTFSVSGDYFNGSFGAKDNTLSVWYGIKKKGSTSYVFFPNITPVISGNTFSAVVTQEGLDYQQEYTLQVWARDAIYTAGMVDPEATRDFVLRPVFDWGKDDFQFNVPVNLGAGAFLGGSSIEAGTWTPTLNNANAVTSYEVRQGWYQKLGKVVTIGWQIKAAIKSGFEGSALSIAGAPFTPSIAAFGGGVAHNIYITGGFCFEGWAINTSKDISARMQPCNNTSAGNLQIASTAYYPTGGGTVTLAGTICFITND